MSPRRSTPSERAKKSGAGRPPRKERLHTGVISLHPRGFAFVALDGEDEEVFVPARDLGAAMHRDRVEVRCRPDDRGMSGKVVRVVDRGLRWLGGTLVRRAVARGAGKSKVMGSRAGRGSGGWRVEPGDPRLPPFFEVRGRPPRGVAEGDAVVVELLPAEGRPSASRGIDVRPEVRVIESLGPAGGARVEVEKMLLREDIEAAFPADVRAELDDLPGRISRAELRGREDLRDTPLLTIDPPDARDHDDAVWAKRRRDGSFAVVVAIADVGHYVPAGSALDLEAGFRGCTHYLPDRVIPMLPLEISAGLASLVPGKDRLAMVVHAVVGPRGAVREIRFSEAVIRSHARLSYEAAARAVGLIDTGKVDSKAAKLRPVLRDLFALGKVLRARQLRQGALFLQTPTTKIELDAKGEPLDVTRSEPSPGMRESYGMVEQMMLLANEVVALELDRRGIATLYRVHEAPLGERLQELAPLAEHLGLPLPKKLGASSKPLSDWLKRVEGKGLAPVLHPRLLRLLRPAAYQVENVGHFGLAKEHYLHFTSPIRRYPDLVVHRMIRRLVREEPRLSFVAETQRLESLARRARRRGRAAAFLSREAQGMYAAVLMKGREGLVYEARLSRLSSRGLGLVLNAPAVEVQAPTAGLPRDRYQIDPTGTRLVGEKTGQAYELGERYRVEVIEVSLEHREVRVRLKEALPKQGKSVSTPPPKRGRPRKKRTR